MSVASTVSKGPASRNASSGGVRCPAATTFSEPYRLRRAGVSSVPTWPTAPITRILGFRLCHSPSLVGGPIAPAGLPPHQFQHRVHGLGRVEVRDEFDDPVATIRTRFTESPIAWNFAAISFHTGGMRGDHLTCWMWCSRRRPSARRMGSSPVRGEILR